MGLMVAGIGFLYANLFKVPVNEWDLTGDLEVQA